MLIITPAPSHLTDTAVEWDWVRSVDGLAVSEHGRGLATHLPRSGECVLVLPPSAVRWHRIQLPTHPAAKRAAVLASVLDERVMGEPDQLHAALPSAAHLNQEQWCAVVHKPWLVALLGDLRTAGLTPHRIVPMLSPDGPPQGLIWPWQDRLRLSIATPLGVLHAAVAQELSALSPDDPDLSTALQQLRCPSALAGVVEQTWPDLKLQVRSAQALLIEAAQSPWNLAQFDLKVSATQRRGQALWRAWTQFWYAPAWRMTRMGVILGVIGVLAIPPALAWRERQSQAQAEQAARALVQREFPEIQLVIDPVVQMRRSVEALARHKGVANGPDVTQALNQLATLDGIQVTHLQWQTNTWQLHLSGQPTASHMDQALRGSGWRAQSGANQTWTLHADKGAP